MSTCKLQLINLLSEAETRRIDEFCSVNQGVAALGHLARFLSETFDLALVLDQEIVRGFSVDSSNLPGNADAICRPRTERECAIILRSCHKSQIACTLSAGRSNLTGSATPSEGVVLSTVNMLKPDVDINLESRTSSAPVGMIIEDFRKAVLSETEGLMHFPVDPTSRAEATIGGAIACNASGFTPGECGAIRHWVEAVDFLLPNGDKVSARRGQYVSESGCFQLESSEGSVVLPVPRYERPAIKNASGPYSSPDGIMDFVDLVVGSEGLFGLVTSCSLILTAKPNDVLDLFFSLPREANALALYSFLRELLDGDLSKLSALEYFGLNCRDYMDHEKILFNGDDEVGVYIQVPLTDKSTEDAAEEWLEFLLEADCGVNAETIMMFDNERERSMFMEARHSLPANALEVVQRRGTFTIMTDTVVPPDQFSCFLEYTHRLLLAEKLDYIAFGHLGDCHLHFTILPEKAQLERASKVYSLIVAKSAELGGVYSGEHGTGQRKRDDFLQCYGLEGSESVSSVKRALDPQFLLNRNNVLQNQ